jgi:hypothetical protein
MHTPRIDRPLVRVVSALRTFLTFVLFAGLLFTAFGKDVHVKGYTRKDGTYVAPHTRSSPNKTKNDNYSTRGNVNPYTGQSGTKPRDTSTSSQQSTPPTKSRDLAERVAFSQLSAGMSPSQVIGLAGEPQMVRGSTWAYRDGWVEFSANNIVSRVRRDSPAPIASQNVSVSGLSASSAGDYQQTYPAETWVKGYTRADGTKVQGHYRTNPNSTRNDNYSTKGNINPHTGKAGTRPRDNGASYTPATHADGTPAHSRNSPSRRNELKGIINTQDWIIDRYTKQTSFSTPEPDRISNAAYETAKESRRQAQRELDLMPQW